jgi:L-ascorbate metabolism protein UlaG (beta-lactamase superfamily)
MPDHQPRLTYIGGPTALLEWGGTRLLTDPTFDRGGTEYRAASYSLRKTQAPALAPSSLGLLDAVLLSHDHHFDNLDTAGRGVLNRATRVFSTPAAAARLGGRTTGLGSWQAADIPAPNGRVLRVTGTPARHGPAHADRGPVTGFALAFTDDPDRAIYISGDTVWYEGVAEVGRRFSVQIAILFMGAARVLEVGPWHLTLTAVEAVEVAGAFPEASIVPLHFEGWEHFSESRPDIEQAFATAGLVHRLCWPTRGQPTPLTFSSR